MGNCPCPRCFITKAEIHNIGTDPDQSLRRNRARVDDLRRQNVVKNARDHIYNKGYAVTANGIEGMLRQHSRVPTLVRYLFLPVLLLLNIFPECILHSVGTIRFRLSSHACA
jgi:hypothetical protein